jgi:hypothetical protein
MRETIMDQTHALHGHAGGNFVDCIGRLPAALRCVGPRCNSRRCAFAVKSPSQTFRRAVTYLCSPLWAGATRTTLQHMTVFGTHPGAFSRESVSSTARNGFFTGALKTRLQMQGKTTDIRHLAGSVRDDVLEATGGRQQPYTAGSLHGDLCLVVPSDDLEPVRPAYVTIEHPCTQGTQTPTVFLPDCRRLPDIH